jgi:hypothetical protein
MTSLTKAVAAAVVVAAAADRIRFKLKKARHPGWRAFFVRAGWPRISGFDFDDEVDFHGDIERKSGGSECGAGVFALFAEDFDEQFGGSVDDLRVAVEVGLGVYKAGEGDDLLHLVERADGVLDDGEAVQDDHAGTGLCLLDGHVAGDLTDDFGVPVDGQAAGKEEEISAADAVDVSGDGGRDGGQAEAEGVNFF